MIGKWSFDTPGTVSSGSRQANGSTLSAVSEIAAQSFRTLDEAIEATLTLMRKLLRMEVRMVNQVHGDRHTFYRLQLPPDMPNLEGMSTPLSHNF